MVFTNSLINKDKYMKDNGTKINNMVLACIKGKVDLYNMAFGRMGRIPNGSITLK